MLVKINENIFGQPPPLPPFANLSIRASPTPFVHPSAAPAQSTAVVAVAVVELFQ